MEKPDYTKLDAAILARLAIGPKFLMTLEGGDVRKEAMALAEKGSRMKYASSFIDMRLQALRKAGSIAYNSKTGWALKKSLN